MEFGQRLLPQVVDEYARTDPSRLYASIPHHATDVSGGFHDVTMAKLAAVVNRLAWWIQSLVGTGGLDAVAYIGPSDIRYAAMFLAAVKCKYKVRISWADTAVYSSLVIPGVLPGSRKDE